MRDDLIQEETRRKYLQGHSLGGRVEEEGVALAARGKKGRPRANLLIGEGTGIGTGTGFGTGTGPRQGKNKRKDCNRVKCWNCHKIGHFATNCPEKKRKGKVENVAASAVQDDFSSRFEQEFSMVASRASP